jgi:hypothetical protein
MNLQATINAINLRLASEITNYEAFGISKMLKRNDDETTPIIYLGSGKSQDLFPDTSKIQYSFFEVEQVNLPEDKQMLSNASVNLIFWGQLDKIDPLKNYDFSLEHLQKIIDILREFEVENLVINFTDVFQKYSLYRTNKQLFMLPYFTAKIKMQLNFVEC